MIKKLLLILLSTTTIVSCAGTTMTFHSLKELKDYPKKKKKEVTNIILINSGEEVNEIYSDNFKGYRNLEDLDASKWKNLERLYISDVFKLKNLKVDYTSIKVLNLSGCRDLVNFDVSEYQYLEKFCAFWCKNLGTLNLSNNPNLRKLDIGYTGLKQLDLSNNPNLEKLDISYTGLKQLDLSNNPNLKTLICTKAAELKVIIVSNSEFLQNLEIIGGENLSFKDSDGKLVESKPVGQPEESFPNKKTLAIVTLIACVGTYACYRYYKKRPKKTPKKKVKRKASKKRNNSQTLYSR